MSMHRAGAPGSAYGESRSTGGRVTSFASTWAVSPVLSEAGRVTSRPTHPRVDQPSAVVLRYYENFWNASDLTVIDECMGLMSSRMSMGTTSMSAKTGGAA